ncbi:NRG1 [Cordylochernes scorpioides]|uniref:NRG1 n=1 Tax=Cordylochernes scorpioides TaxID=51811 RepID=A0ABY6KCA6_9ARAC|nr:NRG1 [Cordylochernes scorpioides]
MQTCKYCGKQLEYKSQLIDHEKTHTGEREFMCDWKGCNFRSNRKFNVAQHKVTHTEEKPFTCDHCPYRSAHKTNFKVHMRKHTNSKTVHLTQSRSHFIRHQEVHNSVLYSCSLCGTRSKSKTYFTKHMKNKHQLQNINIEEYATPVTTSFDEHKRYKHTDPALKCKLCKYVACGEADLRIHACNESLCCGECGYKTHIKLNFTRHQEVHNSVLYSCSLCGKKSKSKPYFKHMKDKHKIQKFNIEEYVTPATTSSDK